MHTMTGRRLCSLLVAALAAIATVGPRAATGQAAQTLTPLLNGRDLTGWKADASGGWTFSNGMLVHEGAADASISTEQTYGDFELRAEYQVASGAQASISLRDAASFGLGG